MKKESRKESMTDEILEIIANYFRLLSDPTRLKILHTLGEREMSVTDLVDETGISQANVSKHLGILLNAGIVSRRKQGLNSIYRVSNELIFQLCEAVCSHLKEELERRQNLLMKI